MTRRMGKVHYTIIQWMKSNQSIIVHFDELEPQSFQDCLLKFRFNVQIQTLLRIVVIFSEIHTGQFSEMSVRSLRRPLTFTQPVLDFLVPRLCQRSLGAQYARITTSSAPPITEPQPESLNSSNPTKKKRPLSNEQREFLDRAVRATFHS